MKLTSKHKTKPMIHVGDAIKFRSFKSAWPVTATNNRFTICVKKLTGCLAKHKYCYTIIDWENKVRGPDNLIFGPDCDYSNPKEATKALAKLDNQMRRKRWKQRGPSFNKLVWHEPELELSRRRSIDLDVEEIIHKK